MSTVSPVLESPMRNFTEKNYYLEKYSFNINSKKVGLMYNYVIA